MMSGVNHNNYIILHINFTDHDPTLRIIKHIRAYILSPKNISVHYYCTNYAWGIVLSHNKYN